MHLHRLKLSYHVAIYNSTGCGLEGNSEQFNQTSIFMILCSLYRSLDVYLQALYHELAINLMLETSHVMDVARDA